MHNQIELNRRQVLAAGGSAMALAALGGQSQREAMATAFKEDKPFKKAVKYEMIAGDMSVMDKFKMLAELGFDGVEPGMPADVSMDELKAARDATGVVIHGVVDSAHWGKPLSDPDPAVRKVGSDTLKQAIKIAKELEATSVLLVPAVVNKQVSYEDAYHRCQKEIREVLPFAEDQGIRIAIENVWNSFLLSPLEMARFIDEFESPMIGSYFDVGNIINYGWPEHWIRTLGKRIFKLDIKEYSRKLRDEKGPYAGFQAELLEGDCDWPAVMAALKEIGFTGWGTAEVRGGDRERLAFLADRMDKIFAS